MSMPLCGDTRPYFLLPFKAEACSVGPLRQAVSRQLGTWGASEIADSVLLAVSELATNVVCHVGVGTPAALLLLATGGHVRIELHDTSGRLPTREPAASDEESGRGLTLVTAVSGGWIAIPTPGGKAMCCEFAMPCGRAADAMGPVEPRTLVEAHHARHH